MMSDYEKMRSGEVYVCASDELAERQVQCLEKLYDFNQTRPSEYQKRAEMLKKLLAEVGEGCYVEPPLHANWGCHTHFGKGIYANFNLTLVDDGEKLTLPPSLCAGGSWGRSERATARFARRPLTRQYLRALRWHVFCELPRVPGNQVY